MTSKLKPQLLSTPELESLLEGPLSEADREAASRELNQREQRPLRGIFEKPDTGQRELF